MQKHCNGMSSADRSARLIRMLQEQKYYTCQMQKATDPFDSPWLHVGILWMLSNFLHMEPSRLQLGPILVVALHGGGSQTRVCPCCF